MSSRKVTPTPASIDHQPDDPDPTEPFHAPYLWTVASMLLFVLWLRPMASSLWLDELGTWWIIQGSAGQAIARTHEVQGQSPLWYMIEWASRHVTGATEIGLRLPSLLFLFGALFFMFRIADRLLDRESARIAVIVFAAWPAVAFQASDMRPYALAVLLGVASTWFMIRWLDSMKRSSLVLYIALAAASPYVHPLFGLVIVPQFVYAVYRVREDSTPVRLQNVVIAGACIVILTIPVGFEVFSLWQRQQEWSVAQSATVSVISGILIPPALIGAAVIGAILVAARGTVEPSPRLSSSSALLFVGWFLLPAGFLVALSIASSVRLLPGRYFLAAAPGGVLLAAHCLRLISPTSLRRIVIVVFAVLSVLMLAAPFKNGDFRSAAELVRSVADERSVVMVNAGFQESMQQSWYEDPEKADFLASQTSYYHVPGTVVPLPASLVTSNMHQVRSTVESAMETTDRIVVVTPPASAYVPWFEEFMTSNGWSGHRVGDVDHFAVIQFSREPGPYIGP